MESLAELFKVHVAFDQSHLFFPAIVQWVLAVLLLAIAIVHGPELLAQWRGGALKDRLANWQVDRKRLVGSVVLTAVYFAAMEPVGQIHPNSGVGFLITSVVYGIALSWLFVHDLDRRKMVLIGLSSLITPALVWYVFAHVFRITLP